jgi:hypothetical protein
MVGRGGPWKPASLTARRETEVMIADVSARLATMPFKWNTTPLCVTLDCSTHAIRVYLLILNVSLSHLLLPPSAQRLSSLGTKTSPHDWLAQKAGLGRNATEGASCPSTKSSGKPNSPFPRLRALHELVHCLLRVRVAEKRIKNRARSRTIMPFTSDDGHSPLQAPWVAWGG